MTQNQRPALTIPAELIDEARDFLRLAHMSDDEELRGFLASSAMLCEEFTGQRLITGLHVDQLVVTHGWQKLRLAPVSTISTVRALSGEGMSVPLAADQYATDIDGNGLGWVRVHENLVSRIEVEYQAGLSASWEELPPTLRQGIVRLAGYFYSHRDGVDVTGPPSAVTALWRPHRRMRMA